MKNQAKIAIMNSFKESLGKQSIDKVTVKEICEKCNVNRQTFYYYFKDLMDIFEAILLKDLTMEVANNRTFETWEGGFLATMNYLKKNSKLILHIYNSSYWAIANNCFVRFSNNLLEDVVEECIEKMGVMIKEKDKVFMVNFYRHVFNGIMIDWVIEGMVEEPEIILKRLLIMISGSIPRCVDKFVKADIN